MQENIPIQYRTVAGIAHFTLRLLPESSSSLWRVQSIGLPAHHQDKEGDLPKCKGFGFVTMAHPTDVQALLQEWPWDIVPETYTKIASNHDDFKEAARFGLRTMSKKRWDQLKDEYLAYQRKLLDELVEYNEGSSTLLITSGDTKLDERPPAIAALAILRVTPEFTTLTSDYPFNCLAFVKNVHPETNKTTLKKLFSIAFGKVPDGLDYVDFTKGMDSV